MIRAREIQPRAPMTVQGAQGPMAQVPAPGASPSGPQLRKPISFAPPGGGSRVPAMPTAGARPGATTPPGGGSQVPKMPTAGGGLAQAAQRLSQGPAGAIGNRVEAARSGQRMTFPNGQPLHDPNRPNPREEFHKQRLEQPTAGASPVSLAPPGMMQTMGAPALQAPAGAGGAVQRTPITGQERPEAIQPTRTAGNQQILEEMQQQVRGWMGQPDAWGTELGQQVKANAARGINENYDQAGRSLDAKLAGRGISYSSIAGDEFRDLEARRAGALSDVDTSIARERANALAQNRSSALAAASGVLGMGDNMDRADRVEARGERGYVDDLRTTARDQALQETILGRQFQREDDADWASTIAQGLGYGTNPLGGSQLGQAGSTYGTMAGYYNGQAAQANAQLGDWANMATQLYGGR